MNKYIYILSLLLLFSCDDALFNAGDITTKEIEIEYFKEVYIDDIFDVYLIQDTTCKIEVIGGNNLIPDLKFNVDSNKKLTIDNDNSARWSREYDRIELYISVDTLNFLRLNAPCNVKTQNNLTTTNFRIWSITDYAEFDIQLAGTNFYFVNSGTSGGHINLSGEITDFSFWARASFQVNAENLISNHVTAKNESMANCYVHAIESLSVEILREGNIYYKGNPDIIEYVNDQAKDKLIKMD